MKRLRLAHFLCLFIFCEFEQTVSAYAFWHGHKLMAWLWLASWLITGIAYVVEMKTWRKDGDL